MGTARLIDEEDSSLKGIAHACLFQSRRSRSITAKCSFILGSLRFNLRGTHRMIECRNGMENVTISPTMTTKLRSRDAANKIRHGSPKLQEVLRERCRQRMREKRGQLFNRGRFSLEMKSGDVQETLTEIVRKELKNLATTDLDPAVNPFSHIISEPLDPEEALELETEILNEEEQWILQEYEKMSQEEIEMLALAADQEVDQVICPVCQTSNLTEEANRVICKSCDFMLNSGVNVRDLGSLINSCVNTHSSMCRESPGFLPLPENNNIGLYLVCDKCSTLTPIV